MYEKLQKNQVHRVLRIKSSYLLPICWQNPTNPSRLVIWSSMRVARHNGGKYKDVGSNKNIKIEINLKKYPESTKIHLDWNSGANILYCKLKTSCKLRTLTLRHWVQNNDSFSYIVRRGIKIKASNWGCKEVVRTLTKFKNVPIFIKNIDSKLLPWFLEKQ